MLGIHILAGIQGKRNKFEIALQETHLGNGFKKIALGNKREISYEHDVF